MKETEQAIARLRRDLLLGALLRAGLLVGTMTALVMGKLALGGAAGSSAPLLAVLALWILLSYRSYRGARLTAHLPVLIASGNFLEAEHLIRDAMRSFCMFRGPKLRTLYGLAVLRHAQQRWSETAAICRELLRGRQVPAGELSRSARLMLAESLLETGDLHGTYAAITELYGQRLTLDEALRLNLIQSLYLARTGAWDALAANIARKADLAELMDPDDAALVSALLAMAAANTGRTGWAAYLRRRAELLGEPAALVARCPALSELWEGTLISADNRADISSGCNTHP